QPGRSGFLPMPACIASVSPYSGRTVSRRGMGKIYYFDNNATTRVAPEVMEAMLPFLTERWGNPSSAYTFGHEVAREVEEARAKAAGLINADPREVVFTSGGTESNNTAIYSAV